MKPPKKVQDPPSMKRSFPKLCLSIGSKFGTSFIFILLSEKISAHLKSICFFATLGLKAMLAAEMCGKVKCKLVGYLLGYRNQWRN
jgi:hypothetical protein